MAKRTTVKKKAAKKKATKAKKATATKQQNVYKPEVPTLCLVGSSTKTSHYTEDGKKTLCGRPQTVEENGRSLVYLKETRGRDKILYPNCKPAGCLVCEGERTGLPTSVLRKNARTNTTAAIQKRHNARVKAEAEAASRRVVPAKLADASELEKELIPTVGDLKSVELAVARASAVERNALVDRIAYNTDVPRPLARTRKEVVAWVCKQRVALSHSGFLAAISMVAETKKRRAASTTAAAAALPPKKTAMAKKARREPEGIISDIAPNPKRPGSASAERYSLYIDGMTVAEALSAGITKADIRWDTDKGFITVGTE